MHFNLSADKPNCRRMPLNNGQTKLILRGSYDPSFVCELRSGGIDILVFSTGEWEDLEWVAESGISVPRLEIVSPCKSYRGLDRILNLVELSLDDRLDDIDLASLNNLKSLSIFWSESIKGKISRLGDLEKLTISYYGEKTMSEFHTLSKLRELDLRMGLLNSLEGIEDCSQLQHLELTHLKNLSDIRSVKDLANLRAIHIRKCPKVSDISCIEHLISIEQIHIECGCESIEGVSLFLRMSKLKRLLLGVRIENAEWRNLLALPCLEEVLVDIPQEQLPKEQDIRQIAQDLNREMSEFKISGTKKNPWVGCKLTRLVDRNIH